MEDGRNFKNLRPLKRSIAKLGLAGLILGLAVENSLGAAPDALEGDAAAGAEKFITGELKIGMGAVTRSDIGDSGSSYGLVGSTIDMEAGPLIGSMKRLEFDWSAPESFVENTNGDDPWGSLNSITLGLKHKGLFSEELMYEATAGMISGYEDEMDDSFTAFVGGYAIYAIAPRWAVMLGAFYSRHQEVETDFDFIPILGLSWNSEAVEGFSLALGLPTTEAIWHFSEATRLILDLSSLEGGVYRLADDNQLREEGYVELVSATASLRIEMRIPGGFDLGLGICHALDREMKLYDSNGENELSHNVENQPGFSINLKRSF